MNPPHRVVYDMSTGIRRLDPLPSDDELSDFYHSRYYELMRNAQRAPDLLRLKTTGPVADGERAWLRATLYADALALLEEHRPEGMRRTLLDIGCGTGDFLLHAQESGWQGLGVEASAQAADIARGYGARVYTGALEALQDTHTGRFTAATLLHVLEHVPDAARMLRQIHGFLDDSGLLLLQVPNDFSELQRAAETRTARKGWWIAVPDHVNYFNFETLPRFVERAGFEVVHVTTNFPMELFLLMGDDYVDDPALGAQCHQKRVAFETSLPPALRRRLYHTLAGLGVGRDCILLARRR